MTTGFQVSGGVVLHMAGGTDIVGKTPDSPTPEFSKSTTLPSGNWSGEPEDLTGCRKI